MSMREPSKTEMLSVAILTAAAMGVTMDMSMISRRRRLPEKKPCLNCGTPKIHANAFCSSKCCHQWKMKKREGIGE